ncbi:hypothetical protein HDU84_004224 [Entophlyctis sp. JEL0112]|nr:hypothetical protein HDU84_004224 [Entophlyctis sp. JEL0112]
MADYDRIHSGVRDASAATVTAAASDPDAVNAATADASPASADMGATGTSSAADAAATASATAVAQDSPTKSAIEASAPSSGAFLSSLLSLSTSRSTQAIQSIQSTLTNATASPLHSSSSSSPSSSSPSSSLSTSTGLLLPASASSQLPLPASSSVAQDASKGSTPAAAAGSTASTPPVDNSVQVIAAVFGAIALVLAVAFIFWFRARTAVATTARRPKTASRSSETSLRRVTDAQDSTSRPASTAFPDPAPGPAASTSTAPEVSQPRIPADDDAFREFSEDVAFLHHHQQHPAPTAYNQSAQPQYWMPTPTAYPTFYAPAPPPPMPVFGVEYLPFQQTAAQQPPPQYPPPVPLALAQPSVPAPVRSPSPPPPPPSAATAQRKLADAMELWRKNSLLAGRVTSPKTPSGMAGSDALAPPPLVVSPAGNDDDTDRNRNDNNNNINYGQDDPARNVGQLTAERIRRKKSLRASLSLYSRENSLENC